MWWGAELELRKARKIVTQKAMSRSSSAANPPINRMLVLLVAVVARNMTDTADRLAPQTAWVRMSTSRYHRHTKKYYRAHLGSVISMFPAIIVPRNQLCVVANSILDVLVVLNVVTRPCFTCFKRQMKVPHPRCRPLINVC